MTVYEFQTKGNSDEDICWDSVWGYVTLWVANKSELFWIHLFSLSFRFFTFMSFKSEQILTKTFVESQFQVFQVYDFQTKANSDQDISWLSVWNYLSLRVSNKS